MIEAFLWGAVATSSLVLGGLLGAVLKISRKVVGVIMAFGAGVLISAVAYDLVYEAGKLAQGSGFPVTGFFMGALVFYFCDRLIGDFGAGTRKSLTASHESGMVIPLVLGTVLDGIPESIVLGLSLLGGGVVSFSMLIAVFISNLPEAIAGTSGMKAGGRKTGFILLTWTIIALVCSLATMTGFGALSSISGQWLAFIQAFAGGAIMVMLANTMMPEAYEHSGKLTGLFTVLGFAVSVLVVLLEKG